MEGRWASLAVRAQREGVLDYRERDPRDRSWNLRESLLFDSMENALMSEHCKLMLPMVTDDDAREEMFDRMMTYDMPWVARWLRENETTATESDPMAMYAEALRLDRERNDDDG